MKSAAFPVEKTLEEFDFEFQSSIDKTQIKLESIRFHESRAIAIDSV
jgi:DNA replication protein DnaC